MPLRLVRALVLLLLGILLISVIAEPSIAQKKRRTKLPSQKFKGYGLPDPVKKPPKNLPAVKPVKSGTIGERQESADKIDALVEARLAALGQAPNPLSNDYVFVRRVYLDTVGAIPTLVDIMRFVDDKAPRKRSELVDQLLGSYGYVSHMYNYWAAVLRIVDRPVSNVLAYPYRDWVKEQLRLNRPYDQWVYEMLSAEGKLWENPAVGYTLRDSGMPLVHVDNTVRVFLGTQIGCAQCHDHPFDKWSQKEFYQLAAFVHGTKTKDAKGSPSFKNGNPLTRLREEIKEEDPEGRLAGMANLVAQANMQRVSFDPKKKLRLPHDYQYSDGKPKQVVEPSVLWGELPAEAHKLTPRQQYATWLTSKENPLFAKTIANRLWKKVMGVGLIEPVDDIRDDSPCQNPELLEFLTQEMIRLEFDQKEFVRTLLFTKTYQRESSEFDPSESEFFNFPGPKLRRMTAEQIWDSILTIAIYNPFGFEMPDDSTFAKSIDVDLATVKADVLEKQAEKFDEIAGPKARRQAMNEVAYRRQHLARASELPAPLPADHFLRQFGQCDRETIEGDSLDPNVPQVLTMFNGPFTHMMLEEGTVIHDNLRRCRKPDQALNVMFYSILNRPPSSRDRDIGLREMSRGDVAMGYGNVVWALINTREFIFVQ